jgi:phosphopantothenoylcysteine decarboxylase/phosphopantothenate--cysteine ligase
MNQQMFANPATQQNIKQLNAKQVLLWGPAEGEQACGDVGPGRMLEAQQLLDKVLQHLSPGKLTGVKLLLTAGPTREAIDPVRYISNRSSGKMGYALAAAAIEQGGSVTLVSGPVALPAPAGVELVAVESAQQMYDAVMQQVSTSDVFIACAAVSDYRVDQASNQKIKKSSDSLSLQLVLNADILATVSSLEQRPFCVGFAAETQDVEKYALGKLQQKNLDMIAANQVGDGNSGFETDFNQLDVFWRDGRHCIEHAGKAEVAKQLIDLIAERYTGARSSQASKT